MRLPKRIQDYIDIVRSGELAVCREQVLLADYVERVFDEEEVFCDEKQLEDYLAYQKYFPFQLFPWEIFCFALHNCVYRKKDGHLRWPVLLIYVGRGAGKNGYLGFEDFCLTTTINGIRNYEIDMFAMSEDQAKRSWEDIYHVLEANERKMRKHFRWNLVQIVNTDTNSKITYNTSAPRTKDSYRPGKVDFDEVHEYKDYSLIGVVTSGLGKVARPRRTIISTDGKVRGGPLDDYRERGERILNGEEEDNGFLPFICRLDDPEEVHDKAMWHKANPSLRYRPDLMYEMEMEYVDYKASPINNADFIRKRMNRPPMAEEGNITEWDNVQATNQPINMEELYGQPCVAGFDYAKTTDFVACGLLFRVNGRDIWLTHTFVCARCRDLPRIKAPLAEWEEMGLLTFVDAPEIPADLPVFWVKQQAAKLQAPILAAGIDDYRWQMMRNSLEAAGLYWEKGNTGKTKLLRPSNEMKTAPTITSLFVRHAFVWGDNPLMRWAVWNTKMETSKAGNVTYGKIEPKSRKTDPFKALVAAECVSDVLDEGPGFDADDLWTDDGDAAGGVMCF